MDRWLGLVNDMTSAGSTYDLLTDAVHEGATPLEIPIPTLWLPGTTAQIDSGLTTLSRSDEVRGRRGDTAPVSFASAPKLTFGSRAYPNLLRKLVRFAFSGTITHGPGGEGEEKAPEPFEDHVTPIETGSLMALIAWLRREDQLDRLTGLIVSELALDFAIEKEGEFTATLEALFHQATEFTGAKEPGDPSKAAKAVTDEDVTYADSVDTFMLRDAMAFRGETEEEIVDLAGFSLTYNNGMIEDLRTRFRPGHNIERTTIEEDLHKLWYPARHKIGAQTITGKLDLSSVDPDAEARRLLTHADRLKFTIAAGPLGTTPPADEMMEIILSRQVSSGGGAEPLVRQGDQVSSFEFSGYLDDENKDIEAVFVGAEVLT